MANKPQSTNIEAFLELLRAGLWEKEARLSAFNGIDYVAIMQLAEEQSVVGLITAGLDKVVDIKVPQEVILEFIGSTLQIEQRNQMMNAFLEELAEKLRMNDIDAFLVKGQGIAQCYEKPMWRASGDIDLLLDVENYEKAKKLLVPLADSVNTEYTHFKHIGLTINGELVELHGTLHTRLSKRIDNEIDRIQDALIQGARFLIHEGRKIAELPDPDSDVIFVFTHFLHHFFFEGVGLRQICDWCRLLWTYPTEIDIALLEHRLKKMGLMSEWRSFAALAVDWLGMPVEAVPLYSPEECWSRKAKKVMQDVVKVGNFGYNERRNYREMSYLARKFKSFWGRLSDMLRHFTIFPKDSLVFFGGVIRSGVYAAIRGE